MAGYEREVEVEGARAVSRFRGGILDVYPSDGGGAGAHRAVGGSRWTPSGPSMRIASGRSRT